jgi:flagellar hook-associated protein 2
MSISSPGIGSNLDVIGIVSKLMAVESAPLTVMQTKEASYLAKISAYGTVKGALSSFQTAVNALSSASTFKALTATPSDATVLSASATTLATSGSYNVNVTGLAQGQALTAAGQASTTVAIGTGTATTLSFQFGTISGGALASGTYTGAGFAQDATQAAHSIVIDSSNNSLQGIRDTINGAGMGVTASIVNDGSTGSPYHLMLTSNSTGAAHSMKITSSGEDASITGLLAYDPAATQNLSQSSVAQNATLTINGLAVSSASNAVADAIGGVTLNLSKIGTSNLSIASNTSAVTTAVQALVKSYNDANTSLKTLTAYDPTTQTSGLLNGDSTIEAIQSKLRAALSTPLSGLGSNTLTNITQIGVSFLKDGTLSLDSTKLQTAMTKNFSDFSALFASAGKPSDSLVKFATSTSASTPGSYAVAVSTLATQGTAVGSDKATQASLDGSLAANLTLTAGGNDHLLVSIDNDTAVAVTLTPAAPGPAFATAADLATQVQTDINTALTAAGQVRHVSVTDNGGKLSIVSSSFGSASAVSVTNDPAFAGNTGATDLLGAPTGSTVATIKTGVNDQLTLSLDGTTASATLAAGTYTASALAAQIQAAVNGTAAFSSAGAGVSVTQSADVLSLTSTSYGSVSSVKVTGGTAFASLFSGSAASTDGVDTAGTINGVAATGSGQFLTGASGNAAEGMKVQVIGGALGARGTVDYSQGYAYNISKLIDGMLSSTGAIASNTDSANRNIASLKKSADNLTLQLTATEKRYRAQYTALDVTIGSMTTTSSFLSQQLSSLAKTSA